MGIREIGQRLLFQLGLFSSRAALRSSTLEAIELLCPVPTGQALMRIGSANDGGYLLPNDLEGITALFSPGVADNWSFELEISDKFNIPVYMCDRNIDLTNCPFRVDDFWIGPFTSQGTVTLAEWITMKDLEVGGELIVQMDIEGCEFLSLLTCPEAVLRRIRILVVEFHGMHRLLNQDWLNEIGLPALRRIREVFEVVHLHPNNAAPVDRRSRIPIPLTLEVTYHRRDRICYGDGTITLPHSLDQPNMPNKPDLVLSKHWWVSSAKGGNCAS